MRSLSRLMSAAVGGLVLLCPAAIAFAQSMPQGVQAVGRVASLAPGSIQGDVQDEKGLPVQGAMVSALGATSAFAVTDRAGHFELRTLSPGPYLVRAHLSGFVASRGQIIDVRPSGRVSSSIAMRRSTATASYPVLAAGVESEPVVVPDPAIPEAETGSVGAPAAGSAINDNHSEIAWRLRHARRGILKNATLPVDLVADETPTPDTNVFGPMSFLGRAVGSPVRLASNFFAGTPFSGQVNVLATGSFENPLQVFNTDSFSRGITYFSVGAPAGSHGDWTARGALTQGDVASWIVAGSYATRAPARHRYDLGVSYSTQRYDGGNPAALRDVKDGSRNAGAMYGFDTFAITPAVALTYGARYARYDYLDGQSLISPRLGLTLVPYEHFRINTLISRRALAPGAEEFLPPAESAIWLPPQRTFSSMVPGRGLEAERSTHLELEIERDLPHGATLTARAFRQRVADQLVTLFGVEQPGRPAADLGHYFVANTGDVDAAGWSAGFRAAFARRVHGSIEYSSSYAHWNRNPNVAYMLLVAPSALRSDPERIHDVNTSIETDVPETSTRVVVFYRLSNGFARRDAQSDQPMFGSRFDVQVRQSLPFMDFSTAKWEMLVAVRNFFREAAADQSLYDELLVVRPPTRIVGGLTLKF